MPDFDEIFAQVEQVGLHQLIVLDGAAQDVRGRLTAEVPHEEYIQLLAGLGHLNQLLLAWSQRLLPMHPPVMHDEECPHCAAAADEEEG